MNFSIVAVLVAFSTLISVPTFAAESKGVEGQIWCEITTAEKEWYGWQINLAKFGIIEGMAFRKDVKGTPTELPIEGEYEHVGRTLEVYHTGEVTRVRPGRTLPNTQSERQLIYKLNFIDKKAWTLNLFDTKGRMIPTPIPCKEYDPDAKVKQPKR